MVWLHVLALVAIFGSVPPETKFIQVAPDRHEVERFERSPGETRAVVLIQGLDLHVFKDGDVPKARFRTWQLSGSVLVATLAREADVFAFAYGQTVPVDEIANAASLAAGVRRLRELGYVEIVLLGHSAGGIVARQFVEDHPGAGVGKVIQVCTPNTGSSWSRLHDGVRPSQQAFVASLSKDVRSEVAKQREGKLIPDGVQFVCILGNGLYFGDGVVACPAQWPPDLQKQGVPAVAMRTDHFSAVRTRGHAQVIAELVRTPQPRLSIAEVEACRRRLLGTSAEAGKK